MIATRKNIVVSAQELFVAALDQDSFRIGSKIRIVLFVVILGFPAGAKNASAATYYISPTGSDTTGNGTLASPWGSLKKAHDNLSPGDTVYARGGTYENSAGQDMQGARWTASGIPGSPITIAAYPGETPVFHRASGGQKFLLMRVVDSAPKGVGIHDVTIDGLTIDGYQNAISTRGCPSFINNTTWSYSDCANARDILGKPIPDEVRHMDNIIIRNNTILNSIGHGIYPGAQTRNIEIYNNRIENPGGHGIHLFHETGVIGGEIYNNVVSGGKVGIGVYTEANGVNVYNNTIYNQTVAGLKFGNVIDVVVENNVVLENTAPAISSTSGTGELADISFDHNLYYRTNSGPIAIWGGTNYQDLAAWQGIIGPDDDNSEEANPLFVNAGAADFHLQSGSPAIDTGASTHAPSVDIDGNSRPIDGDGAGGAQFDKGAHEFVVVPEPSMLNLAGCAMCFFLLYRVSVPPNTGWHVTGCGRATCQASARLHRQLSRRRAGTARVPPRVSCRSSPARWSGSVGGQRRGVRN